MAGIISCDWLNFDCLMHGIIKTLSKLLCISPTTQLCKSEMRVCGIIAWLLVTGCDGIYASGLRVGIDKTIQHEKNRFRETSEESGRCK